MDDMSPRRLVPERPPHMNFGKHEAGEALAAYCYVAREYDEWRVPWMDIVGSKLLPETRKEIPKIMSREPVLIQVSHAVIVGGRMMPVPELRAKIEDTRIGLLHLAREEMLTLEDEGGETWVCATSGLKAELLARRA